jgi:hypothetical protein
MRSTTCDELQEQAEAVPSQIQEKSGSLPVTALSATVQLFEVSKVINQSRIAGRAETVVHLYENQRMVLGDTDVSVS